MWWRTSNCSSLLIYRPREDERLSWPGWLTYSGQLIHISGHPSATGRAQDGERMLARDWRSTAEPRRPTKQHKTAQNMMYLKCKYLSLLSRLHMRHLTATVRLSRSLSYAANTARPGATWMVVKLLKRDVEDDSVSSTMSVTSSPVSITKPAILCKR